MGYKAFREYKGCQVDISEDIFITPRSIQDLVSSFTQGSVIFAGPSGILAQNNSQFFWDNTNNRLGIGTVAPTTPLTVSQNAAALPSSSVLIHVGASNDSTASVLCDSFSTVSGNASSLVLRRSRGTAASLSAILNNDLIGEISAVGYRATAYATASRGGMRIFAGENWSDAANGTYVVFGTTPNASATWTERVRIDNAGNVGIGNTPVAILDVGISDSTWVGFPFHLGQDNTNSTIVLTTAGTGENSRIQLESYRGTHASKTVTQVGDTLGDIFFAGFTNARKSGAKIAAEAETGWSTAANDAPTRLIFGTLPDGGPSIVERLRIHSSGGVSIGNTTDPGNTNLRVTGTLTLEPLTAGSIIFSGASGVLSQDNANLFWDDSNNRLGIGTTAPGGAGIDIESNTASSAHILITSANAGPTAGFTLRTARGTLTVPTAVQNVDLLFRLGASGYGATGYSGRGVQLNAYAAENFTDTAQGAMFTIDTTPTGTIPPPTERVRFQASGGVSIGTTTDLGDKNVNCGGFIKTLGDVSKPSDQSIASSTTLTDDTALTAALNIAGTYGVEACIDISAGLANGGIKIALAYTGTTTSYNGTAVLFDVNVTNLPAGTMAHTQTIGAAIILYTSAAGGNGFCWIKGTIIVSTTGTLKVQWAQNASNVTATTVRTNSHMRVWRIL
ncbi:hypothetical protein HYZ97_03710 [Candidatus Pacearchaeota archaeon]|nr:hypothetical protein [Candidatus Pacearchaeota archaeon]